MPDQIDDTVIVDEDEQAYLDFFKEVNSEAPSAEDKLDDTSVVSESGDSPDDKTPEPDGAEAPSATGTATPETTDDDDDPYAWISDLPPEQQERAKALRHSAVSDAGRVASLQRRNKEVEARLAAVRSTQAEGRDKSPSKGPAKPEEKEMSPKLQEFMESYPQLAESVTELVKQDRRDLEQLIDERLQPVNEDVAYRKISEARSRLEDGASELFDTPNTNVHYSDVLNSELYRDTFLNSQPQEFQDIANTTDDPDTALWVLRQFHDFAERYAQENGLTEEAGGHSKADKTRERRSANKATAGTPASRSAVTDPEVDADYETIFKRMNS
jgi:hypothetical protein